MTMVAVAYLTEKFTAQKMADKELHPRDGFLGLGLSTVTKRRGKTRKTDAGARD